MSSSVVNVQAQQTTQNVSPVRRHHHRHNVKSRYEFIKTLGKGTYGKVKLARHRETNKLVAVKAIKKDKVKDSVDMKHIRREMEIMSSIQHQHIIQIYEVFENQDKIVIVMEYAAGGELYDYLASKRGIADDEAKSFFKQIISAVRYCHNRGIVHRDLKLENILLNENHQIKIADFGLANSFKSDSLLHTFCGSPLYASPEIVNGVPYKGPEVDSWSLGVLLYALVYGTMPFDGTNYPVLTKQITNGQFSTPAHISDAHELICWMLTVDANNRATIEDIARHEWVNAIADPIPLAVTVSGDTLSYVEYLGSRIDTNDNIWEGGESAKAKIEESSQTNQPKGILKRKTSAGVSVKPATSSVPSTAQKQDDVDSSLAGQLAAVCGLHAKDSLKLKVKPQGALGKKRILRSKRDRESGYYSSPERPQTIHEKPSSSEPTLHTNNSHAVPQIKASLATPGRLSRLHTKHISTNSALPPRSAVTPGVTKECYLMPIAPGVDERLASISSDDGSSIGSQTRPASTYSDSSILSSDSFDLCTFDGSFVPPSVMNQQAMIRNVQTNNEAPHRPLSLSLVPDTLPPMNEMLKEDQPPGSLTPKSEKLVRDLQRILAPNGRRNQSRAGRSLYSDEVAKRPQSLDETSQLSAMMNQLNVDLELAYKKAIDICANLKSAEV